MSDPLYYNGSFIDIPIEELSKSNKNIKTEETRDELEKKNILDNFSYNELEEELKKRKEKRLEDVRGNMSISKTQISYALDTLKGSFYKGDDTPEWCVQSIRSLERALENLLHAEDEIQGRE